MTKRLIVHTHDGCERPFADQFDQIITPRNTEDFQPLTSQDVWLFEGGTDIYPGLYNQKRGKFTDRPDRVRDSFEWLCMQNILQVKGGLLGICRGAQLITAFAGGSLIQDVQGHNQSHLIKTHDGQIMNCASVHHQMMYPFELPSAEYKILAWCYPNKSKTYLNGENQELSVPPLVEPEIIWYPKIRGLAIQSHPEYMKVNSPFVQYCRHLVKENLL